MTAVAALSTWLLFGHILAAMVWLGGGVVLGALAVVTVAFLTGAAHQSRAAILAERASDRGDHAEARRQLARWAWGYAAIVVLLAVIVWDMVFKPGL